MIPGSSDMHGEPRIAGRVRQLLTQAETTGSSPVLGSMPAPELDEWIVACAVMAARPGRANSAQRYWRQLLKEARRESERRRGPATAGGARGSPAGAGSE